MELLSEIIRNEARECARTSADMRNMEDTRQTFHILSIVLGRIADECKIAADFEKEAERQPKASETCEEFNARMEPIHAAHEALKLFALLSKEGAQQK